MFAVLLQEKVAPHSYSVLFSNVLVLLFLPSVDILLRFHEKHEPNCLSSWR